MEANNPPTADDQTVETDEDTSVPITLTATDPDNDALTVVIVDRPTSGTLSGTDENLTYTPNPDFNGSDSFTFRVNDGTDDSNLATVSITVNPVNDAPHANPTSATTQEDTPVDISLAAMDVDGDSPLVFAVGRSPDHGTVTVTNSTATYMPAEDFNGSDSFTFTVSDGHGGVDTSTVTITVDPVDDAPVAHAQALTTPEDTGISITLTGSDADGESINFTLVEQPAHGTLSGTGPSVTYVPDADYNGPDSFTFRVDDGTLTSDPATVTIDVTAVNDPPVAIGASVTTAEDTAASGSLTASDVDGNSLIFAVAAGPVHGTVSITGSTFTYTPAPNFNGSDSFTFKASDGSVDSNIATVSLTVTPVNDAPVAIAQPVTTLEDSSATVTLTGTDADGDPLTFAVVAQPTHGTLSGSAPSLTYTPAPNYSGPDSFTFKANDGTVDSAVATVSITVTAVNDAPVATDQSATTAEDTAVSITLPATDVDGDSLTYTIVTPPQHGTLTGSGAARTYTPSANYNGPDSFTFKVSDGSIDSNIATVSLTVTPVNDAPVAIAQPVTTLEDSSATVTLTGTDADGDPLTFAVVAQPAHGTLSGSAPSLTYTPAPNYNGPDSFTFKANDGTVDSAVATVSITVTAVNDAPVATAQSVTTAEDTPVNVTLTASDVEGSTLTYAIVAQPQHGTLSGTGATLTYTPAPNYNGSDSFTFKANDGTVDSAVATVSITVTAVNDAPVATAQSATTAEDTPVNVTLTASDVEGNTLTYVIVAQPQHGTLSGTAPSLTYTPSPNYNGPDSFTFKVSDGLVDSNVATVSISVTPVNDVPVATSGAPVTFEDTAVLIQLSGADADAEPLTFVVLSQPAHGTLSGTPPSMTYTPNANYTGTDSFTFKVNDGHVDSAPGTMTITVMPVNDAPVATPQSVTTSEDSPVAVALTAVDVDGDPVTFTVATQPAHGTLSGTAPNLTYTPNPDYHGPDQFTFTASDGTVASASAQVTLTIAPVNDPPTALAQTIVVQQGTRAQVKLTALDVDGDPLTYRVVQMPSQGQLTGTAPNLEYDAPAGFRGETSFTFVVNDGTVDSAPATVTLQVNNGAPVVTAAAELLNPFEGQPVKFTATAADPGGDTLTFAWDFGDGQTSSNQNPTHAFEQEGHYTVTVTVSDGLEQATSKVEMDVKNAAPIVVPADSAVSGEEATELEFVADIRDPGAKDSLTITWHWDDGSEDTTGSPAKHTFADNGVFHVTLTVTDDAGAVTTATREVTITNVPPVPEQQATIKVTVGEMATARLAATDRAGAKDPLQWSLVEGPGTIDPDGTYRWTPEKDGEFVVRALVQDDDQGSAESVFTVQVAPKPEEASGCGCAAGGEAAMAPWLVSVLLAAARLTRRRSARQ